jgi:hypothetical protein
MNPIYELFIGHASSPRNYVRACEFSTRNPGHFSLQAGALPRVIPGRPRRDAGSLCTESLRASSPSRRGHVITMVP